MVSPTGVPTRAAADDTRQRGTSQKILAGVRLLFVVNDAGFFVSHRLPIAVAAKQAGAEVHVATPTGEAVGTITTAGLVHHPVTMSRSGMAPWREISTFVQLYRLFRRLRPKVIHTVTIKPVIYGGIAARGVPGARVVSAISGLGYVFVGRTMAARLLRPLARFGYRLALSGKNNRVIVQNPTDRELLVAGGIARSEQILMIAGSGVDLQRFRAEPEPQGTPVVLCATRMLRDKGVQEFVEAAQRLRAEGVRARFVLAGDTDPGNPAAIPAATLETWRNAGTVEWAGHCVDMPRAFAQANIVCLPSYREGLPKVLIEAAAAGRAIVTTDTPGCRDVVRHGANGLLVPVADAGALARALKTLIEDASMRARMGARGRAIAENEYGVERVADSTIALYRSLLA